MHRSQSSTYILLVRDWSTISLRSEVQKHPGIRCIHACRENRSYPDRRKYHAIIEGWRRKVMRAGIQYIARPVEPSKLSRSINGLPSIGGDEDFERMVLWCPERIYGHWSEGASQGVMQHLPTSGILNTRPAHPLKIK